MVVDYRYDLCYEHMKPYDFGTWCQSCNSRRFQQNFINWTSGNHNIDEFIQNAQLKAKNYKQVLEWIDYDRFENVEYFAKSKFGNVYKAFWEDGYINCWDSLNHQWIRSKDNKIDFQVVLKYLNSPRDIVEVLSEVRYIYILIILTFL